MKYLLIIFSLFILKSGLAEETKTENFSQIIQLTASRELVVDNFFGSISVTGYDGNDVQLDVTKVIKARNKQKIDYAQEKVKLDISTDNDKISIYVDGPFRKDCENKFSWRGYNHEGYQVNYDFELKVPRNVSLIARTVNEGEINISHLVGNFDIKNINGGIKMQHIEGSGSVYALNGDMSLAFDKNPIEDCYIGSLNGEIRVVFKPQLAAEFKLKTFNGEIYTDFNFEHMPHKQKVQ
ncbi:hypothetical protein JW935_05300, partial [candidate division KSB1 bacterium]|nr:hypothetical protein [candidate division KSB1 bacterium]